MTDEPKKKKLPKTTFKKIKKSDALITRVDIDTYYVKSSDPDKEPWFVFHSWRKGWNCDCPNFFYNLKDTNDESTHTCKHIRLVKETFKLP